MLAQAQVTVGGVTYRTALFPLGIQSPLPSTLSLQGVWAANAPSPHFDPGSIASPLPFSLIENTVSADDTIVWTQGIEWDSCGLSGPYYRAAKAADYSGCTMDLLYLRVNA
jgi:hypothetical protein